MPTPFEDMTFVLTGVGASVDLFSSMRTVLSTADFTITDRTVFSGDSVKALQFGATVDKRSGRNIYTLVCILNYGYRKSSAPSPGVPAPTRTPVSVTLTYPPIGSETVGSSAGFTIDDPPASYTVEAGMAVPPLIIVFDEAVGVTSTFYGYQYAWQATSFWQAHPNQGGTSDRFALRFDPAQEDMSYARLMRGTCYGGSYLNDDTHGTRVRPDLLLFQHDGGASWNPYGPGWWMQSSQPVTTTWSQWRYKPDGQHADAGFGPFCMAYVAGGPATWTNSAYHFIIKAHATRWIATFPHPDAGYANEYTVNYQDDELRAMGRVPAMGAWLYRALTVMAQFRPDDPEVFDLANVIGLNTRAIINRLWEYHKPFALPGEPASVYGRWKNQGTNDAGPRFLHPERGYNGVPAGTSLAVIQLGMGGLFMLGIYHFWQLLKDLGQTTLPEYTRAYELMRFIAVGDGCEEGMLDYTYRWKGTHPHAAPSPFPPVWSLAPASQWVAPEHPTVEGYGWAQEYATPWNNALAGVGSIDDYVLYVTNPTTAQTGESVAMFEFALREGWVTDPTKLGKMTQIIEQYAGVHYRWHLSADSRIDVLDSTVPIGETVDIYIDVVNVPPVDVGIVEGINFDDETVTCDTIESVFIDIEDTIQIGEDDVDPTIGLAVEFTLNDGIPIGETVDVYLEEPGDFDIDITEDPITFDWPDPADDVDIRLVQRRNTLPPLSGHCVSVLPPLPGGEDENGNMIRNQNFTIVRGDDVEQPFSPITLDEERILDGTETWRLVIRESAASEIVMLELNSAGGGITTDLTTHEPTAVFTPGSTPVNVFRPSRKDREFPYDLEMTKDGKIETSTSGKVTVITDIAR